MTFLLDANVLIARCVPEHVHYQSACSWLAKNPGFAVCPITEGALIRFFMRSGAEGSVLAKATLDRLSRIPGYEFWPGDISYVSADLSGISGHKQVTDAYLVALATATGGCLATFDEALAAVHPKSILVPYLL